MATKQVLLRVDEALHDNLKMRSSIERRSINEIVVEAISEYAKTHPVSREAMLVMARAIAAEDASLLKILAEG